MSTVAHLDNMLQRSDGSAALVDWCDASVGPAVDVAICLSDGVAPDWRRSLIATNTDGL